MRTLAEMGAPVEVWAGCRALVLRLEVRRVLLMPALVLRGLVIGVLGLEFWALVRALRMVLLELELALRPACKVLPVLMHDSASVLLELLQALSLAYRVLLVSVSLASEPPALVRTALLPSVLVLVQEQV